MTSEHDTVFEEVKRFVNLALGFAREAVLKEGEFLPYGYALTRDCPILKLQITIVRK
jgi:hypothetical protein